MLCITVTASKRLENNLRCWGDLVFVIGCGIAGLIDQNKKDNFQRSNSCLFYLQLQVKITKNS